MNLTKQTKWVSLSSFKLIIMLMLVFGIFLRFTNLELKPFWFDESYTLLQVSGYGDRESTKEISNKIVTVKELQKYQKPSSSKTALDTTRLISDNEPQLTPLYFLILRIWMQWLGSSIAVVRSLSVISSLLTIPFLYWLCQELFKSPQVRWMAIGLFSVSPVYILYAQEARPPSMWVLTVVLTHLTLLRAIRIKTTLSWVFYALAAIISAYTFILSIFIFIAHGIYIFFIKNFLSIKDRLLFTGAIGIAFLAIVPWILLIIPSLKMINGDWQSVSSPLASFFAKTVRNGSIILVDSNFLSSSPKIYYFPFLSVAITLFALIIYSIYFLCKTAPARISFFVVIISTIPILPLLLQDIISGGIRSLITRYVISSLIGFQLALSYLFGSGINPIKNYQFFRKSCQNVCWKFIIVAVVSLSTVSSLVMSQADYWWNKGDSDIDVRLATYINQCTQPLLVSDSNLSAVLPITHALNSETQILLIPKGVIPIPALKDYKSFFLYRVSQELQNKLKEKYILEPINVQRPYIRNAAKPILWKVNQS